MPGNKRLRVLWMTHSVSYAESTAGISVELPSWVTALSAACRARGHFDLAIAVLVPNTIRKKVEQDGITYYLISNGFSSKIKKWWYKVSHAIHIPRADEQFRYIVGDFDPHLVHIFGTEFGFAGIQSVTNTPLLIHIQSIVSAYLERWYAGGYSRWDVLFHTPLRSLLTGAGVLHARRRFIKQAKREKQFYASTRYITGRTFWDMTISAVLAPQAHYYHCEELLRNTFFNGSWAKKQDGTLTIVTVMNPNLYKGLETVNAVVDILGTTSGPALRWHIVGFDATNEIVRMANARRPAETGHTALKYQGKLGADQLKELMIHAHMYVHPSHIENSANSICEAMALGMPVIASAAGGTGSLVTHGVNGLLFAPGDAYMLAALIRHLAADPDEAARLGKTARETALVRHNETSATANLLSIYSEITR